MLLAVIDWLNLIIAICALIGVPGTIVSLVIFYSQWKRARQKRRDEKILKDKEHEENLKQQGRDELMAQFEEEKAEKEQKQMKLDLNEIKKLLDGAATTQNKQIIDAQKNELGALKEAITKVQVSQKSTEESHATIRKLWERMDGLATEVKDDRHAVIDNFSSIMRWAEAHGLDDRACFNVIMDKLGIEESKRPKIINPILPKPFIRKSDNDEEDLIVPTTES